MNKFHSLSRIRGSNISRFEALIFNTNKYSIMNKNEVQSIIHALIASSKDGILLDDLNSEFYSQTWMDIPYLSLGYPSLHEFMRNSQNIKTQRNSQGNVVYVLKNNRNVDHIVKMIRNQKGPFSRMNKRRTVMRKTANRRSRPRNHQIGIGNSGDEDTNESYDSYGEEPRKPVVINSPPRNINRVHTPIINGQQLIGDDFFLQLAIRNLQEPIWRTHECGPLRCGLCISGLTIRAAVKKLQSVETLSNKVMLMIGAEDLYRGRSADEITEDFEKLLDTLHTRFAFSKSAITICTIPPLANIGIHDYPEIMMNIYAFNNALRQISKEKGYALVDVYSHYTNPNFGVVYDLFQIDARMVSGSFHPYVLFNRKGRRLAVNLINSHNSH